MKSKLVYNPLLSVAKNATNNNVSIAAIRKYIRENGIDRNHDAALLRYRQVKDLKNKNPDISYSTIASTLNISYNTAKKYAGMNSFSKVDTKKVSTFDISKKKFIIKSISDSQDEILSNILRLYINNDCFDADFTYSIGVFYRRLSEPLLKFDKYPQMDDILPLSEAYNIADNSLYSVVIDLPFIVKTEGSVYRNLMEDRFTAFKSIKELYKANDDMIALAYNKLQRNGFLIMKTMDLCFAGMQYWIGNYVQNKAFELGFKLEDTFILISKNKILTNRNEIQHHARKFHSYFFVLKKNK